jgi:hypothetical protein
MTEEQAMNATGERSDAIIAVAPARDLTALDPDSRAFLEASLPDVASLDSIARMKRIEYYKRIRDQYGAIFTRIELNHITDMLAADRAEVHRRKREDTASAKKASAPTKQISLEDLGL